MHNGATERLAIMRCRVHDEKPNRFRSALGLILVLAKVSRCLYSKHQSITLGAICERQKWQIKESDEGLWIHTTRKGLQQSTSRQQERLRSCTNRRRNIYGIKYDMSYLIHV